SFRQAVSVSVALNTNEEEKGGARWRVGVALTIFYHHALSNMFTLDIAMARKHAVVQTFQFDPESDPDGEATDEEVATQRLQQDVSEWLVKKNYVWIRCFIRMVYSYYHVANANLLLPFHERSVTSVFILLKITSSSAILKCGYRECHITNRKTVIQITKKCTTLALQCVYSHT
ncbi:hypothetical protein PO909_032697, partial [Leuciscus waleckii]